MSLENSTSEISISNTNQNKFSIVSTQSTEGKCHILRKPGIDGGKTVECEPYLMLNYKLATLVFGKNNRNFVAPNYKDLLDYSPDILKNITGEFARMYSPLTDISALINKASYSVLSTHTHRRKKTTKTTVVALGIKTNSNTTQIKNKSKRKKSINV